MVLNAWTREWAGFGSMECMVDYQNELNHPKSESNMQSVSIRLTTQSELSLPTSLL